MKHVKLGEIIERLTHGGTPPLANESLWIGNIPWITGADFANQKVANIRRYISAKAIKSSATNLVARGDLLLVTRTGVGKLAIAPCDIAISQDITGVKFDPKAADTEFMYYLLQGETDYFLTLNQGTAINGIIREDLLNLEIEIPSKQEQIKIVDVLRKVDQAIEQTEALIAKYQRIKTGLMHDLLTCGIDEHGRLRDPATHKFKPSPVGLIPEEWHVSPLEAKKRGDRPYIKTGPFGSSLKIRDWVEEGVPVITIGALGQGEIIRSELLFVSEAKAQSLAAYTVEPGDLLFSRVADVGRSMVIDVAEAGWIMSSNLMRISLDQSLVVPAFAYLSFLDERTAQQTRRSVNASGREVANTAILKALQFAWPSLGEQSRIVSHIATHDDCIHTRQVHLDKLKRMKTGLMQDLLTGKVSVEPLLAAD